MFPAETPIALPRSQAQQPILGMHFLEALVLIFMRFMRFMRDASPCVSTEAAILSSPFIEPRAAHAVCWQILGPGGARSFR